MIISPQSVEERVLETLLEWSPIIVTGTDAFKKLYLQGIKVDVIIGEQHKLASMKDEIIYQEPIDKIIIEREEKVLDRGVDYLINKKSNVIYIFDDHLDTNLFTLNAKQKDLGINVINGHELNHIIVNGLFEKWLPVGFSITIIPSTINQAFTLTSPGYPSESKVLSHEFKYIQKSEGLISFASRQSFIVREII